MNDDTDLGGPAVVFPVTRCSVVRAASSSVAAVRQEAVETLVVAYWKPVYKHIRLKWQLSNEDAKDLTQAFFFRAMDRDFLDPYDPARGRFRTFLRVCVDGFVANEQRAATRLKRGGGQPSLSLDFDAAERELTQHGPYLGASIDDIFHQEWVRSLFSVAVEELRRHCAESGKDIAFSLFERYDLDGPNAKAGTTYAQLAAEFGLPVSQVTNFLAAMRRQFRQFVLEQIRATTGSEDEYHDEVRRLFGGQAP